MLDAQAELRTSTKSLRPVNVVPFPDGPDRPPWGTKVSRSDKHSDCLPRSGVSCATSCPRQTGAAWVRSAVLKEGLPQPEHIAVICKRDQARMHLIDWLPPPHSAMSFRKPRELCHGCTRCLQSIH
jgi:hypothetical protein